MKIERFLDDTRQPTVSGFLHIPEDQPRAGFVLAHGAGSNAQAPLLQVIAEVFADAGHLVLRIDLPFRQRHSFGPPRPTDAARDREGLANAVNIIRNQTNKPVFLGGHSYGGRQASMLCAEDAGLVSALLLLSYPLHPPGKPDQPRNKHLPDLRIPTLFVHGTHDPFGSIAELEQAKDMIPARTDLLVVERAGHDLGFKGKSRREELPGAILTAFRELISENPRESAASF